MGPPTRIALVGAQLAEDHHGIFSDAIDVTLVNLEIIATEIRRYLWKSVS